ncbi:error-prone DNA polymerase [Streptomyces sp. NPDC006692]|uniref:error-prone DNA polymerase n=1 Tax=unclassified Streptomyces TaxID=2593676 RepID=UPI00342B8311
MADARILRLPSRPASAPIGRGTSELRKGEEADWAELHVHSSFSFLQGAAAPDELASEAATLGVSVLAVTDRDGLYAARRHAEAARVHRLGAVYGAELTLGDPELGTPVVLARGVGGFRRLARVISAAQLAGAKGEPRYDLDSLVREAAAGQWAVLPGCTVPATAEARLDVVATAHRLRRLTEVFGLSSVYAELVDRHQPLDSLANDTLFVAARQVGVPVAASGAVHYAHPRQARLSQALAALRRRDPLDRAAGYLDAAPTAHLRTGAEMQVALARYQGVYETTLELGRGLVTDLSELRPELPDFAVPEGHDEDSWLRHLAEEGCTRRYGPRADPAASAAWRQLDRELSVIAEMSLSGYFLIVEDVVAFARRQSIWCQGRGSAASSVVCYCLGITGVDALRHGLLFERFLHVEKSDPDIDIDFEAGRREEVIQYVYNRYGRQHAAQVANVITYQPRLSVTDAARVLGYPAADIREMTRRVGHEPPGPDVELPNDVRELAAQLHTLPRHLGVHSGGMVVTRQPIGEIMPTEWATAPGRSVLSGDKDDVAAAGLVKIDLLGLGILSALHTACDLIAEHYGRHYDLATIPQDDPDVYRMIADGRTVGVFQAESRAQVSTLPQMRPTKFDDLAIAASIIRPGPIQAGSKHPFLRRRRGEEPVTYPHPLAQPALEKTLGVALYQEQAMQLAMDCAGFSAGEADRLRKAMAAKHAPERVASLRGQLLEGMAANGIPREAAERIVAMIEAFSGYGFPESHAQSMASLIYASAWIKHHHPEALLAGILAHQPMGFYDTQTLIEEARRLGIRVHAADVNISNVHATLEPDRERPGRSHAIRRGLTSVTGLSSDTAQALVAARAERPFTGLDDLAHRTSLSSRLLERLATAGALRSFGEPRRTLMWAAGAFPRAHQPVLPGLGELTPAPDLPVMAPAELTAADYAATGASAAAHPCTHLRPYLVRCGAQPADAVRKFADQVRVRIGGLAKYIQRPPTANGVAFGVIEDETAMANLVFSPPVWDAHHTVLLEASAVVLDGHIERAHGAVNVIVHRVQAVPMPLTVHRRSGGRGRGR